MTVFLCLEEMREIHIDEGALWYWQKGYVCARCFSGVATQLVI